MNLTPFPADDAAAAIRMMPFRAHSAAELKTCLAVALDSLWYEQPYSFVFDVMPPVITAWRNGYFPQLHVSVDFAKHVATVNPWIWTDEGMIEAITERAAMRQIKTGKTAKLAKATKTIDTAARAAKQTITAQMRRSK